MKGGSGGGGGSTSGKVDYPEYMKSMQLDMMCGGSASGGTTTTNSFFDTTDSLLALIHAGVSTSPYVGEIAYDPDVAIATFVAAIATFSGEVAAASSYSTIATGVAAVAATVVGDTTTNALTVAHAAILDDRLTTEVLPRFQSGMRDINAVISSSFVVGQAVLEAFNTREVADFDAKVRTQAFIQKAQFISDGIKDELNLLNFKLQYKDSVMKTTLEAMRFQVIMKKEELDTQLAIDEKDARWGIDLFQAGGNLLASIAGAAISNPKNEQGSGMSVLGGALSGAAAGASIGGPVGAGIGAVVGMAGSLF